MSFIGNMFNSEQGAGFQAKGADIQKPITTAQAETANTIASNAVNNVMDYNNLLQRNNYIGQQDNVFTQQQRLADMLTQQAAGGGPNPALAQLAQATAANTANQAALMAGQRGSGANAGLIARQAAMQGSANQQQMAGQAAVMQAQQQLAAQQMLAQQQSQMQASTMGMINNQMNAANMGQQGSLQYQNNILGGIASQNNAVVGNQANVNSTNASMAQANMGSQDKLLGGVMKGAGGALGLNQGGSVPCYNEGGAATVPGQAQVQGDHPVNDTVPAMLSPGEIVIPRSIVMSENAPELAARFVQLELEKQHLSSGGFVQDTNRMADGDRQGEPGRQRQLVRHINSPTASEQDRRRKVSPKGSSAYRNSLATMPSGMNYADGGTVEDQGFFKFDPTASNFWKPNPNAKPLMSFTPSGLGGLLPEDKIPKKQEAKPSVMPEEVAPTNYALPQSEPSMPMANMSSSALGSMNSRYRQGVQQEAAAMGQQGQIEAQAADAYMNEINTINADTQQKIAANMAQRQQLMKDYNDGKVDPKRLWNSKTDLGRISTAIGVLLGGIGSGMAGGDNPALTYLQKQIDADIDAQKAELGKKENLLTALQQEYGDINTAAQMARVIKMDQYKLMIDKAASQTKDPIAKARALQLSAKFDAENAATIQTIAQRQAVMGAAKSGRLSPEQQIQFLPKEQQEQARKALAEYAQIEATKKSINDSLEAQYSLQSTGNRLFSPISTGKQLDAQRLAPFVVGKEVFGSLASEEREIFKNAAEVGYLDSSKDKDTRKQVMSKMLDPKAAAARKTLESMGIFLSPSISTTTPVQGMKPRGR